MLERDGTHSMMVNIELQTGANARAGDLVSLTENRLAAAVFDTMTHSQKKEYVDWISTAKQAATKMNRVTKAIDMLALGKKRVC
jgi:uncharacterized protein YdeI (YjbR/CyaY-like superfamily)